MKKRLIIICVVLIALVAITFLFTSGKKQPPSTKGEAYQNQKPAGSERLLYKEAEKFAGEGELLEARQAYKRLLAEYPDSNLTKNVRSRLDELNMRILFSPVATEDSIFYEVKPGDTLRKIAKEFGTTVELIMKSNNLASTLIMPKMQFKISNVKYSILVDKSQNILMLKAKDEILKTYTVSTGKNHSTPTGSFRAINKLIEPTWYKAGAVVPPGSPENILGSRWIGLDFAGYGIHGTTDESTIGRHITKGCVRMKNSEVEELYSIVPIGTEITIID
jgi:lipoprotein-anchoring transpeptidase ErfK/SrfK